MAEKRTPAQCKPARARTSTGAKPEPQAPRLRLKLKTVDDVKAELARLYREGKAGTRDMADVSKLAYVLNLLAGLLQPGELEARLARLEQQDADE